MKTAQERSECVCVCVVLRVYLGWCVCGLVLSVGNYTEI